MANRHGIDNTGGGSGENRLGLLCLFLLSLALLLAAAHGAAWAQTPPPPPPTVPEAQFKPAERDSLVVEIRRYSRMISAMRDSLSLAELGLGLELDEKDKAKLERSIQEVTGLIEEIGSELGGMDLQIANNKISLLDAQGEGIVINIPENFVENLDESLSQGLNVLSQLIISELPDSLGVFSGNGKGWQSLNLKPFLSKEKPEKRKVIKGNVIKVWDRLQVTEREDVRGNVVVVFGDAEVAGRVDGNVVVVFGDLQVTDSAEVTGRVLTIGGRLDQDPRADVNDVQEYDPWGRLGAKGPDGFLDPGPMNFLLGQGEFLFMLLFGLLASALVPAQRLERSVKGLAARPLASLGTGVLGSMLLHILAITVMAILVLTVIGIPVALLVAVVLLMLGVLSVVLVALALGRRICSNFGEGCSSNWLAVVVGLLVLHLVAFLGQLMGIWPPLAGLSTVVSILGAAVKLMAYFFGLGALALTRFGSAKAAAEPDPLP